MESDRKGKSERARERESGQQAHDKESEMCGSKNAFLLFGAAPASCAFGLFLPLPEHAYDSG